MEPAEPQTLLRPDVPIGDEHYCDPVHLGQTGQKIFTEWFVDEIVELTTRRAA